MNERTFKPLDLRDFLKDSPLLNIQKESYPAHLRQLLEQTLNNWEQGDKQKAKQLIVEYNSHFDQFQIGTLVELSLDFEQSEAVTLIAQLNEVPESQRAGTHLGSTYHFVKAVLYYSLMDIDEARMECDRAISLDDKWGIVYLLRGICYALRERHVRAIADYRKALIDSDKKNEVLANLAYSYLRIRKSRKALRLHKRIVNKFPDDDKVQYNTGLCYKRIKKYRKALYYFNKAIELDPNNYGYKLTRGRVLMRLKMFKEAALDLQNATESGNQVAKELLKINTEVLEGVVSAKKAEKNVVELLGRISKKTNS